ncbi:hypothetical protein GGI11_001368, partial [Coemansia sp. RSA 2049]
NGFEMFMVLYIVIGLGHHKTLDTSNVAFIVLFTLAQFFQNFDLQCYLRPRNRARHFGR